MEALSLLVKPSSGTCNMRCSYCFYADVTETREHKNRGMMSKETLEALIEKTLAETTKWVSFSWQGGEPLLMGLDFFKRAVELQHVHNRHGATIVNTIQTNGLLIDGGWASFFAENSFLVGLSLDATKELHDYARVDAAGAKTHERVLAAAETLTECGAEFNILTVLTGQVALEPERAYRFYKRHGFRFIQFIPCLDGLNEKHGSNQFSLSARVYGDFLCTVFDLWYKDFIEGDYYSIRAFDNWVRMLMGEAPDNCGMLGQCQPYPTVEADGSVYPCDFYVLDDYRLGDVLEGPSFEEMLTSSIAARFMAPSQLLDPTCASCGYHNICRGGCRRDREPLQEGRLSLNYYCEAYKRFFDHALPRMQDIAAKMPRR